MLLISKGIAFCFILISSSRISFAKPALVSRISEGEADNFAVRYQDTAEQIHRNPEDFQKIAPSQQATETEKQNPDDEQSIGPVDSQISAMEHSKSEEQDQALRRTLSLTSGYMTFFDIPDSDLTISHVYIDLDSDFGFLLTTPEVKKIQFHIEGDFRTKIRKHRWKCAPETILRQSEDSVGTHQLIMPRLLQPNEFDSFIFHVTALNLQCQEYERGLRKQAQQILKASRSAQSKVSKLGRKVRNIFTGTLKAPQREKLHEKVRDVESRISKDYLIVSLYNFEDHKGNLIELRRLKCLPSMELRHTQSLIKFLDNPPYLSSTLQPLKSKDRLWEVSIGTIKLIVLKKLDPQRLWEEKLVKGLLSAKRDYDIANYYKLLKLNSLDDKNGEISDFTQLLEVRRMLSKAHQKSRLRAKKEGRPRSLYNSQSHITSGNHASHEGSQMETLV